MPNDVDPEPKVVKADVLNAIGQIREAAAKSEGNGWVNVDMAMVVVRALENELGESPIVHVESGGVDYARIAALMADDVADMVVKRLRAVLAKRQQVPAPAGMSPLPWRYSGMGCIYASDDTEAVDLWVSRDGVHEDGRAIVEAVNAYFSPTPRPPTPAEAASGNPETAIPDTAGYPLPDYDAVDIPSFENASQPTPSDSDPLRHALADALASATSPDRRIAITSMCLRSAVAGMAPYRRMSFPEMDQVAIRMTQHLVSEIKAEVSKRTTTQLPAA